MPGAQARDSGSTLVRLSQLPRSLILPLLNIPSMVISSNAMVIIIASLRRIMSTHAVEKTSGALFLLKMSLNLLHWPRQLDSLNWKVMDVLQQIKQLDYVGVLI